MKRLFFIVAIILPIAVFAQDADSPFSILIIDDQASYWQPWEKAMDEARGGTLIEQDYEDIAEELGVLPAAIHAVVDIEAGNQHQGFWDEGKPLINFDLAQFKRIASSHGVNLSKYSNSHSVVFNSPNIKKYGSYQAAQQARFDAAMEIDSVAAIEGTFWGMFQIGGFNWKRCDAESPQDFVKLMSRSERDQLDLFAHFLKNTGLDEPLQELNWTKFARGYNGAGYAAHNYHTRLAKAYNKYK